MNVPHIRDLPQRLFRPVEQSYTERDTMLYALGLGIGQNPTDPRELSFVYEEELKVLPTQATVLASPGFWMQDADTGIDWKRLVAGGHTVELFAPIPVSGVVSSTAKVTDVFDCGADKGAVIHWERDLMNKSTGDLLARIKCTAFARGNGGFGGRSGTGVTLTKVPLRSPDQCFDWQTTSAQHLLYRLSGDMNPLHASPAIAKAAGFERPILHGLCTLGIATFHLVSNFCSQRKLVSVGAVYTGVVFPGDVLRTEVWREGDILSFRTTAMNRSTVVLDCGLAKLSPA